MKKSVLLFVLGICGTAVFAQDANVKSEEIKSEKPASAISSENSSSTDIIQKKKMKVQRQAVFIHSDKFATQEEKSKVKSVEK